MSKSNQAMILGCSHAQGAEMWQDPSVEIRHLSRDEDFGILNSYAALIAQDLGFEIRNYALGGGSNDAMVRIFLEQITNLSNNDIVIACWTGMHRTELYHEKNQVWLQATPGTRSYLKRIRDDLHLAGLTINEYVENHQSYVNFTEQWNIFCNDNITAKNNKIKNIVALNTIADAHGIMVYNFNSFDQLHDAHINGFYWPARENFMEYCEMHGFPKTTNGHWFKAAHRSYANHVLAKIDG